MQKMKVNFQKLLIFKRIIKELHDLFQVGFLELIGKGPGGLSKAPTRERREKLLGEWGLTKFIHSRFERRQVVGFRKYRRKAIS